MPQCQSAQAFLQLLTALLAADNLQTVGFKFSDIVIKPAGSALKTTTILQHQKPAAGFLINKLGTRLRSDQSDTLTILVVLGNKHPLQLALVVAQGLGVSNPIAGGKVLKPPRGQHFKLGGLSLLVKDVLHLFHAPGRDVKTHGPHHQHDRQRSKQRFRQQLLFTHTAGEQHRHLAFEVHPPIGQQNSDKQAQRQN